MRIALIHALPVSIPPIEEAFTRLWPEAETVNLTDDSLAGDLAAAGTLPPEMTDRFRLLARYSAEAGADARVLLFPLVRYSNANKKLKSFNRPMVRFIIAIGLALI